MRPLNEEETKLVLAKLVKYIGDNVRLLIERKDSIYVFRIHHDRVYYCPEKLAKIAANASFDQLISFGSCFGKFTKSKKFKLSITCLDYLAPFAKFKVWLKPSAEQSFLYGHHVSKSGLAKMSENTPQYQGVVIYSMTGLPLGFGVAAKNTTACKAADPMAIVCFHEADIGEYLRNEEIL